MHRGVINKDSAFLHHFLQMAKTQWVGSAPTGAHQHHFQRIVQALEYLAQFRDHRFRGHILHPAIFRPERLVRQNQNFLHPPSPSY